MIFTYPYPLGSIRKRWLLTSCVLLVGITFVLLVFQPFGTYNWNDPKKPIILFGYAVLSLIPAFIVFFLFRIVGKNFFIEESWVVWKELIWWSAFFLFYGLSAWLYAHWVVGKSLQFSQFICISRSMFLSGLLPSIASVFGVYFLFKQPLTIEYQEPKVLEETGATSIVAENGRDSYFFHKSELLFVESSHNYCTLFLFRNSKIEKVLIRSSLSRIQEQIKDNWIIRCHRSYLVNVTRVSTLKSNPRGYFLQFYNSETKIPVSRQQLAQVRLSMRKPLLPNPK